MRLICPNCGAQYEVPDDVIPETGRDVQCSNCGDTWFQKHPDQDAELADELGQPLDEGDWTESDAAISDEAPEEDRITAGSEPTESVWPETGHQVEDEAEDITEPQAADALSPGEDTAEAPAWEDETPAEPAAETEPAPQQRELPDDVRDVLREEAEREREARAAAGGGGLETQPDLGLDDSSDESSRQEREARLRMARMRGMSEKEAMTSAGLSQLAANASRRDLLPDIDEINSTLRKDSERKASADTEPDEAPAPAAESSGFSRGFSYMLLLFALMLALYVFADKLAEMLPQLEPLLESYVSMVNRGRLWIDGQLAALLQWLDSMTAEA